MNYYNIISTYAQHETSFEMRCSQSHAWIARQIWHEKGGQQGCWIESSDSLQSQYSISLFMSGQPTPP